MITLVLDYGGNAGLVELYPIDVATEVVFEPEAGWFGLRREGRLVGAWAGDPKDVAHLCEQLVMSLAQGRQVVYLWMRSLGKAMPEAD